MPLTDPVPSSAFDVLERNIQDTDKFLNQETGTFTNRVGKEIKPIPVIEAEANASVISLGWHQVGLFADGFTYLLQNDIAKDAAGDWYRWNGTLPKVVTAGTLPSSDANFVKIDYKSHAELSDRNPGDGSAHNAADISAASGFTLEQLLSKDFATISGLISAFGIAAWAQASNYQTLIIDINTSKSGSYAIPAKQLVYFMGGSTVTQTDNLACFTASTSGWSIQGNGNIVKSGALPTALISGSVGISVLQGSVEHNISGHIIVSNFAEAGVKFNGGGVLGGSVSYASTSGLICHSNWDGFVFLDGFSSEYHSLSNCWSRINLNDGVLLESGNITWNGGGSVSNENAGVHLRHPAAGGNPHHGMFIGANINHNITHSIHADKVNSGHTFMGCNTYDNGDKTNGKITFDNCRNVTIEGGILACSVEYIDDGSHPHRGYNMLNDMRVESGVTVTNGSNIFRRGNYTSIGTWGLNDKDRLNATKVASSNITFVGSASNNITALMNTAYDNRGSISATFGTFVAPYDMTLTCALDLTMIFSSVITDSAAVLLKVDPTATGSYTTVRTTPLLTMCQPDGLKAHIPISIEFDVVKGAQVAWFIEGLVANNNVIYADSQMIFKADY